MTKIQLKSDEFVDKVIPDPSTPEAEQIIDSVAVRGYLGKSPEQGKWRLYQDPSLSDYLEISEEDIISRTDANEVDISRGNTILYVKQDGNIRVGRLPLTGEIPKDKGLIDGKTFKQLQYASFLGGDISSRFLSQTGPSLGGTGGLQFNVTPTIVVSLIACPSVVGASIAWCTSGWK